MRYRNLPIFHQSPPVSWLATLSLALMFVFATVVARADDDKTIVRWDIVNLAFTTPPTVTEGGVAFATTKNPTSLKIRLTGSGTFPDTRRVSNDVTGGGTWETFTGCPLACVSTGGGTYRVTKLVSWKFDNFNSSF